ncbi:MAG: DUF4115 domain-containing protein [Candidatus Atribacteria bacterium]|nr:DUF4115 domain-containing protein [Candidatus Atribacteria bacterium]
MNIGETLRSEREKQKLTLSEVSEKTLINTYYLEQIEEENFGKDFDGFMLSYIKKYAEFLGIDPKPLTDAYKELFKDKEIHLKPKKKKPNVFVIIIIILIVVGLIFAIHRLTKNAVISPTPSAPEETTPSQPSTPTTPSEIPPATQPTSPEASTVTLILKSAGRCWLGITIDGKYTQRFINSGETITLTGNNYIQIRYGNAKVVTVNLNGKSLGTVSNNETVVEVKYTKNGAEKISNP